MNHNFRCTNCGYELRRPAQPYTCPKCGRQAVGLFQRVPETAAAGAAACRLRRAPLRRPRCPQPVGPLRRRFASRPFRRAAACRPDGRNQPQQPRNPNRRARWVPLLACPAVQTWRSCPRGPCPRQTTGEASATPARHRPPLGLRYGRRPTRGSTPRQSRQVPQAGGYPLGAASCRGDTGRQTAPAVRPRSAGADSPGAIRLGVPGGAAFCRPSPTVADRSGGRRGGYDLRARRGAAGGLGGGTRQPPRGLGIRDRESPARADRGRRRRHPPAALQRRFAALPYRGGQTAVARRPRSGSRWAGPRRPWMRRATPGSPPMPAA